MDKTIAIVGASSDRAKFGNKAVRAYVKQGWTVYPVNPKESEVEGLKAYPSVADLPDGIERISLYVPSKVGVAMLPDIARKSPKEFWVNPGAEDAALIAEAERLGLAPIQACSIVNIGLHPETLPE